VRKPDHRRSSGSAAARGGWWETGLALALVVALDRLGLLPRLDDGLAPAAAGAPAPATGAGLLLVLLTLLVGLADLLRQQEATPPDRNGSKIADPLPILGESGAAPRLDREKAAGSGVGSAWRIWRHG
jgi:hypothetical protein